MTASTFKISSGQSFEILTQTAEVVAKENLKSFNFSQSGGGGYVGQYGGYVKAPTLHAHENNTDRIWLRDKEGNEFNLDLTNMDLPVREGQMIKQFFVASSGSQGRRVGVLNESTGQYLDLAQNSHALIQLARNWKSPLFAKFCFLLAACLFGAWMYVHFFAKLEASRQPFDAHFTCVLENGPAPMRARNMTADQYRAALEKYTAAGKIQYAACMKGLAEKERLAHDANVQGYNEVVASLREFRRKGYPNLVAYLGWGGAVFLFMWFVQRMSSKSAYAARVKNETTAAIRKFMTA